MNHHPHVLLCLSHVRAAGLRAMAQEHTLARHARSSRLTGRPGVAAGRPGVEAVRPRRLRGLVAVLGAYAGSLTANRLLTIALPWFVLTTTGSAAKTGLVVFCQIAPFVVSQALAGPLIDRIGPRLISMVGDVVSMMAMAAGPLLYAADALPLWALMVLVAVLGAADGPSYAAKSVFLPSVTRAAHVPLERGTGLTTAVERTAMTVGPAAAGLFVAAFGAPQALWFAAALFGAAALIVATSLANPASEDDEAATTSEGGYFTQLRAGATFLRKEGLLRAIIGMVVVTNLLDQAFMAVLLPVWAREAGHGAEAVGFVVSVFGATSIVAAIAASALADRLPRRTVYLIGYVIGGLPRFVAMALMWPLWGVLAVFAVGGLGSGFINPIIGAVTYERIPGRLLGRVRTLSSALSWSGIPFGGLLGAGLITLSGLSGALWIVGGLYLIAIVLPSLRPEWAQMNRQAVAPPPVRADGQSAPPSPSQKTEQTFLSAGER